jgi:hypothetical protein
MIIKCIDNKKIEFDDNLVNLSKTLEVLKKYSTNNTVYLKSLNSKIVSLIQEWLTHRLYVFDDIDASYLFQNHKYDKNFFSLIITKKLKSPIIIELLKAADFLNISPLIDSLVIFISIRLINFSSIKINNYLTLKRIPKEIKEKIFFCISNRRFLLSKRFGSQCLMTKNYTKKKFVAYEYSKSFHEFYNAKLNLVSYENKISYDTFKIFDSLNGHFIFYEKNKSILKDIIYPNAKLNLDFDKSIFLKYFGSDLENGFLSGGIFSSYDTKNAFSKKYENYKELFKERQSFDLYIVDKNDKKLEKYFSKFRFFDCFEVKNRDLSYKNAEIIVKLESYLVKIIFIRRNQSNNNENSLEIIEFSKIISSFDFLLTKIFYAFKIEKTLLHIGLFKIFERPEKSFNRKFKLEDYCRQLELIRYRMFMLKSNVCTLKKFVNLNEICSSVSNYFDKIILIEKAIDFLPISCFTLYEKNNEFNESLKATYSNRKYQSHMNNFTFHEFINPVFLRFLKYAIKGYYNDEFLLMKNFDPLNSIFQEFFLKVITSYYNQTYYQTLLESFSKCLFKHCMTID